MKNINLRLYITLALFACASVLHAQSKIVEKQFPTFTPHSYFNTFYSSFENISITVDVVNRSLQSWIGYDNNHELRYIRTDKDMLGIYRDVFQHFYLDKEVENELVLVHYKNNRVFLINGQFTSDFSFDQFPLIDTKLAVDHIIKHNEARNANKIINESELISSVYVNGKVEFLPLKKVKLLLDNTLLPKSYYVDANYKILKVDDFMYDSDVPSQSLTYYKGIQDITVNKKQEDLYILHDSFRNISTYYGKEVNEFDYQEGYFLPYYDYVNDSSNFISPFTQSAVEVHWGMKWTYDYFKNIHNRASYDDNGARIDNYNDVNHEVFGGHGMNASAIDTGDFAFMVYGDGLNQEGLPIMNPVVGMDVAGHEFAHLVISRNGLGGLVYRGESGAINESIADVFGTSVEFYSQVQPNWTIAEGVVNAAPGFLRDMSHPNTTNMPDTYKGNFWFDTSLEDDKGGVHYNSSVGNFWFFLLVNGGLGTNDLGNDYQVQGIGLQDAQKIVYRALTSYLTPNSSYFDYYFSTRQAAVDLFGINNSSQWNSVNNAWYAVGIGKENAFHPTFSTESIAIYPNPATQYFIIDNKENTLNTILLLDQTGKIIIQKSDFYQGENFINIEGVSPGIYLLLCTTNHGKVIKKLNI